MQVSSEIQIPCGGDVRMVRGRTMTTRDGVTLVSDHYFPPEPGPAPTLLMRQPYGRDIASTVVYAHPVWFARRGYNVVIQDVRGRGDSSGHFYPFRFEAQDGFDTIEWVSKLPECNGKVGMYGFSYQGSTQLLAAAEQPPALKAIAPAMTAGDLCNGWFYSGGLFKLASSMGWGNQMLREDAIRCGLVEESAELEKNWTNTGATFHQTPYGKAPHLTAEGLPTYFKDWAANPEPNAYWAALDVSTRWSQIAIPALHVVGWYDTYAQGSVDTYLHLRGKAGTEQARKNQYLIAGPWQHIPWSRAIGEVDFGANSVLQTDQLLVDWFDMWLKDKPNPQFPKVRLFTLGSNTWSDAEAWPPENCIDNVLYLNSQGRANSLHGDGVLTVNRPEVLPTESARDCVVCDPAVPVPSPGPGGAPGAFKQNRIEAGNNVLVYTSETLGKDVWVCGQPRVILHIQSTQANCDVVVKLLRVDSQGNAWNICVGAARAGKLFGRSYGLINPDLADVVRTWEFPLDATSSRFFAGEKIRLVISGNCFPLFDRSSGVRNIRAHEATPANWRRYTHQVLHDSLAPSRLILPEVIA